jgi:N12 class adenine-specific DNA methylase
MANFLSPEEIDSLDVNQTPAPQQNLSRNFVLSPEDIDNLPAAQPKAEPVIKAPVQPGERPSTTVGGPRQSFNTEGESLAQQAEDLPVIGPAVRMGRASGYALGRSGKAIEAAAGDVANLPAAAAGYTKPLENLSEFASQPYEGKGSERPLPIERRAEVPGAGRFFMKAGLAPFRMEPQLAAGFGLGALGLPAAASAAIPMLVNERGEYDPIGAGIAAGIPGASRIGEEVVSNALRRIPIAQVMIRILGKDPMELKGRVVQKLGGIEFSNDNFRKFLESGGGFLSANAYLAAAKTPEILALPEEQRKQAALDMVAENIAPALLGFIRPGMSRTLESMGPEVMRQYKEEFSKPPVQGPGPTGTPPVIPVPPVMPKPGPAGAARPMPNKPMTPQDIDAVTPAPVPPVAANKNAGTVPETPQTINEQMKWLVEGKRKAVMITHGEEVPVLPKGMAITGTPAGLFIFDPKQTNPAEINAAVMNNTIGDLLGYGTPAKPAPGTPAAAVVVRGPDGTEKQGVKTDAQNLPKVVDAAKKVAGPGDTVTIEPEQKVIDERNKANAPNPVIQQTGLPVQPQGTPPIGQTQQGASPGNIVPGPTGQPGGLTPDQIDEIPEGQQPQAPVVKPQPPATTLPATMETARAIVNMTPEEFHAKGGSFNKINLELGKNATPEEYAELKQLRDKANERLAGKTEEYNKLKTRVEAAKKLLALKNQGINLSTPGTVDTSDRDKLVLEIAKLTKQLEAVGNHVLMLSTMPQFYNETIKAYEDARATGEPTPAQREAGNYPKRKVNVHGLEVSVEVEPGGIRRNMPGQPPWEVKMPVAYGYIKRTVDNTDEAVDVYLGPQEKGSTMVYVIDQVDPQTRKYDEPKTFIGFDTVKQVLDAYKGSFSDGSGQMRIGGIKAFTVPEFKKWLNNPGPVQYREPKNLPAKPVKKEGDNHGKEVQTSEGVQKGGEGKEVAPKAPASTQPASTLHPGQMTPEQFLEWQSKHPGPGEGFYLSAIDHPLGIHLSGFPAAIYRAIQEGLPVSDANRHILGAEEAQKKDLKDWLRAREQRLRWIRESSYPVSDVDAKALELMPSLQERKWVLKEDGNWHPPGGLVKPAYDAKVKSDANKLPKGRGGSLRPGGSGSPTPPTTPEGEPTPAGDTGENPQVQPGIRPADAGQEPGRGGADSGGTPTDVERLPTGEKPGETVEPQGERTPPESAPVLSEPTGTAVEPAVSDPQRPRNISLTENPAPVGVVSRANANIAAIALVRALEKQNRFPTDEERKVLAAWSGWGSFKEVFNEGKAAKRDYDPGWVKRYGKAYDKLKSLLSDEEFAAAAESSVNAHFTSMEAVHSMWDIARHLGYKGGRALEGSAGSGVMIGYMPQDLASQTKWVAVEMEPMTGKILTYLYPEADVRIQPFERTKISNGRFDIAITNVPFHETGPGGTEYDIDLNLHNYCIARNLDKVKAGGIAVIISSAGTMDSRPKQRAFIASKADLVGAIRLPSNAFKESAGTEVVTDILIFRKPDGRPFDAQRWANTVEITTPDGKAEINEYFAQHPEMVLGKHALTGTMYRKNSYTVEATPGDITEKLKAAIAHLPEDIISGRIIPGEAAEDTFLDDGTLTINEAGKVLEAKNLILGKPEWDTNNKTLVDRAKDYIGLRNVLRRQYDLERNPESTDEDIEANRKELKKAYDKWTRKHGELNLNERKISYLSSDPQYYTVLGLELVSQKMDPNDPSQTITVVTPSDVLTKRVNQPDLPPAKAGSGLDALSISLAYKGTLDMDYMSQLTGMTEDQLESELIGAGVAFKDPVAGTMIVNTEYLTGDIRDKLARAIFAAKEDNQFERNVEALKKVIPPDKPFSQIKFEISSRWMPEGALNLFAKQVMGIPGNVIKFVDGVEEFAVKPTHTYQLTDKARTVYSTKDLNALDLLQHALNFKRAKIMRTVRDGDKERTYEDVDASALANQIIDRIKEEFLKWAQTTEENLPYKYFDSDRGEYVTNDFPVWKILEQEFNKKYGSFIVPDTDGSKLTLPGLSTMVRRAPHLMNGVMRAIVTGNAVYGHGVGSGKTYLQIVAAHELMRIGKAKKIVHVVKKPTVGQFRTSIERAYPGSKVLIPSKKDFDPANRQKLFARIASGRFDFIVLTHEQFKGIPTDPKSVESFFNEQIDQLRNILKEMGEERAEDAKSTRGMDPTVRNIVRKIKGLRKRLENHLKAMGKHQIGALSWQDLGIDGAFIDESHNFKKLPIATQMDVKGIPSDFSQRAVDLLIKMRDIQRKTDGRNVFFASGTPVSNTLAELWLMFHATNPKLLEDFHVKTFDSFASTFADVVENFELGWDGRFKDQTRMSSFKNAAALTVLTRMGMDVKMGNKELGLDVPEMRNGKPTIHAIKVTPAFERWVGLLEHISDTWAEFAPKERFENSWVPIATMRAGVAAALDPRLLFPDAEDHPASKVNTAIADIYKAWEEGKELRTTMMVFADMYRTMNSEKLLGVVGHHNPDVQVSDTEDGLPKDSNADETGDTGAADEKGYESTAVGDFNLYEDMRKKLIARGVPEHEIAIITEHDTDAKRESLLNKLRQGMVRIVFGSTEKIGEGVDVPQRMSAQFHLDPPMQMTPAKMEQRIGRIIRQGNMHSPKNLNLPVDVHFYAQERSMDAAIYQMLETKSKMVTQALQGQYLGDTFEDPAGELTLAMGEMMAAATGDSRPMERARLAKEVRELKLKEGAYYRRINELRAEVASLTEQAKSERNQAQGLVAISEVIQPILADKDNVSVYHPHSGKVFVGMKAFEEWLASMQNHFEGALRQQRDKVSASVIINNSLRVYMEGWARPVGKEEFTKEYSAVFYKGTSSEPKWDDPRWNSDIGGLQRIPSALAGVPAFAVAKSQRLTAMAEKNEAGAKAFAAQFAETKFDQAKELQEKSAQLDALETALKGDRVGGSSKPGFPKLLKEAKSDAPMIVNLEQQIAALAHLYEVADGDHKHAIARLGMLEHLARTEGRQKFTPTTPDEIAAAQAVTDTNEAAKAIDEQLVDLQQRHAEMMKMRLENAMESIPLPFGVTETDTGTHLDLGTTFTSAGEETYVIGLTELQHLLDDPRSGLTPDARKVARELLNEPVMLHLDWSRLRVELKNLVHGGRARGSAHIADWLIQISKQASPATFPHEIFHFLYELLPAGERIRLNEFRQLEISEKAKEVGLGDPLIADFLSAIYKDGISSKAFAAILAQANPMQAAWLKQNYHLINSSEFLASAAGNTYSQEKLKPDQKSWWNSFLDKMKQWVQGFLDSVKRAIGLRADLGQLIRELLAGRFKTRFEGGLSAEENVRLSVDETNLTKAEREALERQKTISQGEREGWIPTQVLGVKDYVRGREQITPDSRAESTSFAKAIFDEAGIPSAQMPAGWWKFVENGSNQDEAGEKLIKILTREIQQKNEPGKSGDLLANVLNSVMYNFRPEFGGMSMFSRPIREELYEIAQSDRSQRGLALGALAGFREDMSFVSQNIDVVLNRIYSDAFGGTAVSSVMRRVLEHFRNWFSDAEIRDALASKPELEALVTRLIGLNRRDEGSRVYRKVQGLLKPKNAKTIERLESDARVQEAVDQILQEAAKMGIEPKKNPQKPMSPLQRLLLMVSPETGERIDELIGRAITDAERNAGIKAMLREAKTEEERQELEQEFANGGSPTEEAIESGLDTPEFSHWKAIRDNLIGYSPTTVKLVQDLIRSDFKGTRVIGRPNLKPVDTRLNLEALAKAPEEEVKRVLDAYYEGLEANMDLASATGETVLRVREMIEKEVTAQLEAARKRFRDPMFKAPVAPGTAPTAEQRAAHLINAGLFADERLNLEEMVDRVAGKSRMAALTPKLSVMIKAALETPFYRQSDLAKNFGDQLVEKLGITPEQADKAAAVFAQAFDYKFERARESAQKVAKESITPKEVKLFQNKYALWKRIERAVNAGIFDTGEVLREIAKAHGWQIPTDGQVAYMKDLAQQEQKLRELTPREAASVGSNPSDLAKAQADKEAATLEKRVALKKKMEVTWSRMTRPISLAHPWETRRNIAAAVNELVSANLLLRVGFVPRQLISVLTQGALHTPTRALAVALGRWIDAGAISGDTKLFTEASVALKDAYSARLQSLKAALYATRAAFAGRGEARNVDRLMSSIAAIERVASKAEEYDKAGEPVKAFLARTFSLIRLGYRVAQALDNLHGLPAEYQEMVAQVRTALRAAGKSPAEIEQGIEYVMGDMQAEWAEAIDVARIYLENAGIKASEAEIKESAWSIVKRRQYDRMKELHLPADDFEEENRLLRNTIGWNERETSGVGAVVGRAMAGMTSVAAGVGLPLPMARFGNAIAIMINRALTFTPLYKLAEVGGEHVSPWFRTRTDRNQRRIEASMMTAIGTILFLFAAFGALIVKNRAPKDKEERDLFDKEGHKAGTVEIPLPDGSFIPISMTTGPMQYVAPYLAAGGAVNDLVQSRAKAQAKMNAEAEAKGLTPGKVRPVEMADLLGVAGDAAWASITGGRTASGLIASATDYGTFNATKFASSQISPLVPVLPELQELSRMAGVSLDSKMATFWDFMLPLPTSAAAKVNMLGDPVGNESAIQRVIQSLTGGTYWAVNAPERRQAAGYDVLFNTGYRPPSIDPNKGYPIGDQYRPMTPEELQKYTVLRGQYLKEELQNVAGTTDMGDVRQAYQAANQRALQAVGVDTATTSRAANTATASTSAPAISSTGPRQHIGGLRGLHTAGKTVTATYKAPALRGPSIRTPGVHKPRAVGIRRGPSLRPTRGIKFGRPRRNPGTVRPV